MQKKIAYICHPWREGKDNEVNTKAICFHLAIKSNIVPMSTGIFFNSFLNDNSPIERRIGIEAGLEVMKKCDVIYVYKQNGISEGMHEEIQTAEKLGIPIQYFEVYPWE